MFASAVATFEGAGGGPSASTIDFVNWMRDATPPRRHKGSPRDDRTGWICATSALPDEHPLHPPSRLNSPPVWRTPPMSGMWNASAAEGGHGLRQIFLANAPSFQSVTLSACIACMARPFTVSSVPLRCAPDGPRMSDPP